MPSVQRKTVGCGIKDVMVLCRGRSLLYSTGGQVESVAQMQLPALCRKSSWARKMGMGKNFEATATGVHWGGRRAQAFFFVLSLPATAVAIGAIDGPTKDILRVRWGGAPTILTAGHHST
jgi:hypothetical protein